MRAQPFCIKIFIKGLIYKERKRKKYRKGLGCIDKRFNANIHTREYPKCGPPSH